MNLEQLKQDLFTQLKYRLGDGMIDIELDPEHYETALRYAINTYRQRAQNSTEESYTLVTLLENQNTYTLPDSFVNVRTIFRRTVGLTAGAGSASAFDPFSSAAINTYLLNYSNAGGLATYEMYSGYVELTARMFGGYINFVFNPVTKELKMVRDFKSSGEQVLIHGEMQRPIEHLLTHPTVGVWITDWTMSVLKVMLGEAREKFASIAGPGGGTSLNGAAMKAEGFKMQETLLQDLKNYTDGSQPLGFLIG